MRSLVRPVALSRLAPRSPLASPHSAVYALHSPSTLLCLRIFQFALGALALTLLPGAALAGVRGPSHAPELAGDVARLLRDNCAACHSIESQAFAGVTYRGDLDSMLDLARLRATDYIDLERPEQSELYLLISEGEMPPARAVQSGMSRRLTPNETATVLAWIRAGAPVGGNADAGAEAAATGEAQTSQLVEHGRVAFEHSCTACHAASRALGKRKTIARWRSTVERMAAKPGARVRSADVDAIVAYLASRNAELSNAEGTALPGESALFESLQVHGTFSAMFRDSGKDDRMENPGFTAEAWLSAEWHSADSIVSARVTGCTTCHQSGEPEGRGIEIVEAAFRFDINRALGTSGAAIEASIDGGRILVPFGAFSTQSNPAAYRTVARPLIYNMGQGVDRSDVGPAVLPMPYSDEGFLVHLKAPLTSSITADFDAYVVNGLQGTLDVDFYQSRAYYDNNGDPALGGRLSIGTPSLALGFSGMSGNMESGGGGVLGRLGYEILGLDLTARIGRRLRLTAEVARRRNDQVTFLSATPRGKSNVDGYVLEADILLLEDRGISLITRLDSLRYDATVAPITSSLSNNFRTDRFTWGFEFAAWGASSLMLNHEHWSMPAGLSSVDILGLRWVVSF